MLKQCSISLLQLLPGQPRNIPMGTNWAKRIIKIQQNKGKKKPVADKTSTDVCWVFCFIKFCIILTLTACSRIAHFNPIKAINVFFSCCRLRKLEGSSLWKHSQVFQHEKPLKVAEGVLLCGGYPWRLFFDSQKTLVWLFITDLVTADWRSWHLRVCISRKPVDLWSIHVVKGAHTQTHRIKDWKLPWLSVWSEIVVSLSPS